MLNHTLITGGSSGIGKAVALRLAPSGGPLTLVARGLERLDAAAREVRAAATGAVQAFSADVANERELRAVIRQAEADAGAVHTLVASAGVCRPGRFEDVDLDVHERTMAVNYFGCLYAVRAVLPAMRTRGDGHICLVSSGAGLIGFDGYSPYAPTKFALRGLAECLRGELRPFGVSVSIVYPPDTDTPQLAEESLTKPEETRRMTGMARVWPADDVARAIVRGIERRRFEIAPGWEMRVLARLHSLLAPVLRRRFDRITREVRRAERIASAGLPLPQDRP